MGGPILPRGNGWSWVNLITALPAVIVRLFVAATIPGASGRERSR